MRATQVFMYLLLVALVGVPGSTGALGMPASTVSDTLTHLDADYEGRIGHTYAWSLPPGAVAEARLSAGFDAYLVVLDEAGEVLAEGGAGDGAPGEVRITFGPVEGGSYTLIVTSWSEEETGRYTLRVAATAAAAPSEARAVSWNFAPPRRVVSEEAAAAAPRPLATGAMQRDEPAPGERLHRYQLPVAPGGGTYDVWLFAESDYDLYGAVTGPGGVVAGGASRGAFGYEHIRLAAPPGAEAVLVHVAFYDESSGNRTYYLLADRASGERETQGNDASAPPPAAGSSAAPYAGLLAPGQRMAATIVTERYTTQFWTLVVPEGVRRVEVGIFGAAADFDLSVEPGWSPGERGFAHRHAGITKRWNERVSFVPEEGGGVYTVAVWPAGAGENGAADYPYEIEVAFDGPLPPSSRYTPPSPGELDALPPQERARLSAVWIEGELHGGAGALVTPDGLILTNYHVIADCHPSAAVPTSCLPEATDGPGPAGEERLVWLVDPQSGWGVQSFIADVLRTAPEYDLALLEIVADVDGRPVGPERGGSPIALPFVSLRLGGETGADEGAGGGDARAAAGEAGDSFAVLHFPGGHPAARPALAPAAPDGSARIVDPEGGVLLYALETGARVEHSGGPVLHNPGGDLVGLTSVRYYAALGPDAVLAARPTTHLPAEWAELIAARGGFVAGRGR